MSNLGNFVWSIADQLRGVYKPHQVQLVQLLGELVHENLRAPA